MTKTRSNRVHLPKKINESKPFKLNTQLNVLVTLILNWTMLSVLPVHFLSSLSSL